MVFLMACSAGADDVGRGGYGGSFLKMGVGARALATGGGSVSWADDGYAGYYNPAGLVFLQEKYFTASAHKMALDRSLYYVGFSMPLETKGNERSKPMKAGFSLGWLGAMVDNIDARGFNGEDLGTLSHSNNCFHFGFALNPHPCLGIGISGKALYSRFPGITDSDEAMTANGFAFDLGILLKPYQNLQIGFVLRDMNGKYTWDSQKMYEKGTQTINKLPKIWRGGVSWQTLEGTLLVHADVAQVERCPVVLHAGAQYAVFQNCQLRAGLEGSDPSFGLGYRFAMKDRYGQLDYAFVPDPVAPTSNHVFTWSLLF